MTSHAGRWVWLSFCDEHFLGVCVVEAVDVANAVRRAWELGCNPGGAVLGGPCTPPSLKYCNRLLTKEEALAIGGKQDVKEHDE